MKRLFKLLVVLLLAYPVLVVGLALAYVAVPPVSTLMLSRWLSGQDAERTYVPLAGISRQLPAAVLASEDARFCQHGGVDWSALQDVISDEDGPSRGASTIPMQVAKNLFLWPSRSYVRKALEIPLALVLDVIWSKRRMIEIYLNIAEWGDGTFGAEAAARRHFGKPARDLTRQEAALLAASLPNPLARNPGRASVRLRALAGRVQARMDATPVDCLASAG